MMMTLMLYQLYVVAGGALFFVLVRLIAAERWRFRDRGVRLTTEEAPSLSICIPARNETNAMTECLESVLASDYPKFEVIVLDDNSTDNTSHLIRAFAHAGVRFVQGAQPPEGWLGKNFALEQLLEEASGRYILFLDTDTRLEVGTVSRLMALRQERNIEMLSVIPQRTDIWRASTWCATLRHFWEIIFAWREHPGAASSAWLIDRQTLLQDVGGFTHLRDAVQPERLIAGEYAKTDDYQLLISSRELGLRYEKKWTSHIDASLRLLYPRFGGSVINVLIGVGLLAAVIIPQIVLLRAVFVGWNETLIPAVAIGLLAMLGLTLYHRLIWSHWWWLSWLVSPYIAWQELIVLVLSAINYHRGAIRWKGRHVPLEQTRRQQSAPKR